MLWKAVLEFSYGVPKAGDRFDVLVEADDKTVLYLVLGQEAERVEGNIAKQIHTWLYSPIVVVIHHQRMAEEKARFKSAHVAVIDGITVNDTAGAHHFSYIFGALLIDPLGKRPVLFIDQAIASPARDESARHSLECCVEWLLVEENPVIAVFSIESIFDLTD